MTYEQIEKEFEELVKMLQKIQSEKRMILYTEPINGQQAMRDDLWAISTGEILWIEKHFKQSFIKYLQAELDRIEMIFQSISSDSEYARGKDDILLDQMKHLEAQIKELDTSNN